MSKFKVGDVVVARYGQLYDDGYRIQKGYVGTVTDIDDMGYMSVDGKVGAAGGLLMRQGAFELYKEETMETGLKYNIARMEKELKEMKATLEAEEKKNAYVGDKKVTLELTLDEWASITAVYGETNTSKSHYSLDNNSRLCYKVDMGQLAKIASSYPLYEKLSSLITKNS